MFKSYKYPYTQHYRDHPIVTLKGVICLARELDYKLFRNYGKLHVKETASSSVLSVSVCVYVCSSVLCVSLCVPKCDCMSFCLCSCLSVSQQVNSYQKHKVTKPQISFRAVDQSQNGTYLEEQVPILIPHQNPLFQ